MSEHEHQVALFQWAQLNEARYPELRLLFAVPNGGLRDVRVARKLKREGVKRGVPDIWLPVARRGCHGFVGELKFGRNTLTDEQEDWFFRLQVNGWRCVVAYDWEEMAAALEDYLGN